MPNPTLRRLGEGAWRALVWWAVFSVGMALGITMGFDHGAGQGYRRGVQTVAPVAYKKGYGDGYRAGYDDGWTRAAQRTGCHPFGKFPHYKVVMCQEPRK